MTTTVSAHNFELVKGLGANQVIHYKAELFEKEVRGIDVVFDTVGGDTLRRSWGVLKQNGRLVTIAADSETTPDERAKEAFFIVEPNRQQLVEIGRLLDAGDLRPIVDTRMPFAQASEAYTGTVERKGRGKVVVVVEPGEATILTAVVQALRSREVPEKRRLHYVRGSPGGGCPRITPQCRPSCQLPNGTNSEATTCDLAAIRRRLFEAGFQPRA